MKTLPQLRTYIYDFLDIEVEDLSEDLIDAWADEGYDRIVKAIRKFPHFETVFTVVTSDQDVDFPTNMDSIGHVLADGVLLAPIGERDAIHDWVRSDGSVPTGTPQYFSVFNDTIKLWPEPSSSVTLTINGWRKPTDWVASSGTPDMPEQFEGALLAFLLYRAYGHQGLIEEAMMERNEFEGQLVQMLGWETTDSTQAPMILHGGKARRSRGGIQPLVWPS